MAENEQARGWKVAVSSKPQLTHSPEVLKAVRQALSDDAALETAMATLSDDGTLRAEMTILDPRRGQAMDVADTAFYDALRSAGFAVDRPGWELMVDAYEALPK